MSCTKIIGEMKLEGFDTMHTSKIKNYLYPQIQKKKLSTSQKWNISYFPNKNFIGKYKFNSLILI